MNPLKLSELKIREEFNDCPGGEEIKQYLYKYNLNDSVKFVDIEGSSSWENDGATMVVAIGDTNMAAALALGKFATEYRADEFDWKTFHITGSNTKVIRLWWD